jgi:hypothetical protein
MYKEHDDCDVIRAVVVVCGIDQFLANGCGLHLIVQDAFYFVD